MNLLNEERAPEPKASLGWLEVMKRTAKKAMRDDVSGRSAQLSYYFFLAIFPLLICLLTFAALLTARGQVRQEVLHFLPRLLPSSASGLVHRILTRVSHSPGRTKMSLGLFFSLWSASAGMSAIIDALNKEYGVKEGRSFIKKTLVAIALTIITALLLVAAMSVILIGGPTARAFSAGFISSS